MSWTYDGVPGTSTAAQRRDAVRLFVGDTDTNDQQIMDAEISFALSQADNDTYAAAALICRTIAGKYSRQIDSSVESVRRNASQRQEHYLSLAERYEQRAATIGGGIGTPVVGGISVTEMDSVEDDNDRVNPQFKRGLFNNPPESDFDNLRDDD